MKDWKPELQLLILSIFMLLLIYFFNHLGFFKKNFKTESGEPSAHAK
jgi:hypothetical protein